MGLFNIMNKEFELYEQGKEYNSSIAYLNDADKNERFYAGDQWRGVKSGNLPTPVFNVFKRITDHIIAYTLKNDYKVEFLPKVNYSKNEYKLELQKASVLEKIFNSYFDKNTFVKLAEQALLDAALSGDMCVYVDWKKENNEDKVTCALVDGSCVFFGNVYESDIQKQPYVLICGRELTSSLKKEAEENGVSADEIKKIVADSDDGNMIGDRGKVKTKQQDDYSTYIIKFYRNESDGLIYFKKVTKNSVIKNDTCTMLDIYPIAWENWCTRKNSYHGQAFATGLVSNQVFINKCFAMGMKSIMDSAFPKVVYNKNKVEGWSNSVGGAIGVNGDIDNVAQYIKAGQFDESVIEFIDKAIGYTKDAMGASDVVLGDVNMNNASAIKRLQDSSNITMDKIRNRLVSFVWQIACVFLKLVCVKGGVYKDISIIDGDRAVILPFSGNMFNDNDYVIRVSCVSEGEKSEKVEYLNKLLSDGYISFNEYITRIPSGVIDNKQLLISE